MPSRAFTVHLRQLLLDADDLYEARRHLKAARRGRQLRFALNRAAVVMSMSAWESYVEELMRESAQALRPTAPPFATWEVHNNHVNAQARGFHTPNTENVVRLIANCTGLASVNNSWTWQSCTPAQAAQRLNEAMRHRHEIAHGVNPRPPIHNYYSTDLPEFVRQLARCTDVAVRNHLTTVHGVPHPWPL